MFELLLVPLLTLHLTAVSIAAMGPLFCLYFEYREARRGDNWAGGFGRLLARRSLECLMLGILLGGAQLALSWYLNRAGFWQAMKAIEPSRWWFAGAELCFSFGALLVYWATWNTWRRRRLVHAALAFFAATNLAYHFPTLFVIVGVIAQRPALWEATVPMRSLLFDREVVARILHYQLAAVATTGVFVIWQATRRHRTIPLDIVLVTVGAGRVALVATLAQLPLGLFLLIHMSGAARHELLGNDLVATSTFGAAIAAAIGLLHHLGALALGDDESRTVRRTVALLLLVLVLMVSTRHRTRGTAFPHGVGGIAATFAQR